MKPALRYKIGDRIKIVDKRPRIASCGWVSGEMDKYLGHYGNVTEIHPFGDCWKLDCDGKKYWWSEDCFDEISKTLNFPENPGFDVSEVELLQLLGV